MIIDYAADKNCIRIIRYEYEIRVYSAPSLLGIEKFAEPIFQIYSNKTEIPPAHTPIIPWIYDQIFL